MPRNRRRGGPHPSAGEALRIAVDITMKKFVNSEDSIEWEFPSSLTATERAYVHAEANKLGLKSKSRGKGSSRYLTIYKRDGSAIMHKDATINLTNGSRNLLKNLLAQFPVTTRERQICVPPVERCKDSYQDGKDSSRALGRMSAGNALIPKPPPGNKALAMFRTHLPIYPYKEKIVHTINECQVTIISGQTGSGKSTQVPQYLLEWHEQMGQPCRIICAQPRRISVVSTSERVALERGEKLGLTVGYQIRLEGIASPHTVLMYCTNGVLLRNLMAGDAAMSSVTHIIIDEAHERDRLTDFTLIVLREFLPKFRSLRIILMSATVDAKQYSAYFNNCPIITVPGKLFEVKDYFLEDILKQTWYMSSGMEAMKKKLNLKKAQAAKLDKWTNAVTQGDPSDISIVKTPADPNSNSEMDIALSEAWATASDSSFIQVLYLIQSENVSVDYQHTETGVTPLMVAAARGSLETVEQLLNLGADINIRAANHFTALDWATKLSRQDISDTLEAYALNFENIGKMDPVEPTSKKVTEADAELLELYHSSFCDSRIDNKLILALISYIHRTSSNQGSILIFLPGFEDIISLREILMAEMDRLEQETKIILLVLHSRMESGDQKKVFIPAPPNSRKIILSTNIAETSVTIDDVYYVIDTGKVKEKSYNALTGVSQLTTVWISKSCAEQRRGRAGRTQPGVCYRTYSSARYEALEPYPVPELLRSPLQELCLFAKLLAPPNMSIVDFLSRALDPPSSLVSRSAVQLLKTIDALDTWEDLTDLGHHLLDFPVDPRYGKMLIYALVLKCLDPVMTIISCLSYREIFVLPWGGADQRKINAAERVKFSNGSLSDHMILLKVFQAWQEARKQRRDRQFCQENCINGAAMELVMGYRAQAMTQLRASGFIKSKGSLDIKYVNMNSDNWAVVKAALVGGLYPNLARVDREHHVLRTMKEHKVKVHATSVLSEANTKKPLMEALPSDWIMYEELTKVGRQSHILTATVVSPLTVAIFAGPSKIPLDALSDSHQGSLGSDSEEEENEPEHTAVLKIDDWVMFRTDSETAQLVLNLRFKWHSLLSRKLQTNKVFNHIEEAFIHSIVKALSNEEQALGLIQPRGVGKRPDLVMNCDSQSVRVDFDALEIDSGRDHRTVGLIGSSSSKNSFDRYNGSNKTYDEWSPVPNPEALRSNNASHYRYFIIKAGQIRTLELSVAHKMWAFLPPTHNRIIQAFKSGKTVILVFSIQSSGEFQGFARLLSDVPVSNVPPEFSVLNPLLPIEWIKRANLPLHLTRHSHYLYNELSKIQAFRDGQELDPTIGETLCQLWDSPAWSSGSPPQNHYFRPSPGRYFNNYKM